MYVKRIIAALLLTLLLAAPAYAASQEQDADAEDSQDGASVSAANTGEQETVICAGCERTVVVGGHGQAGKTAICPYCGKEIFAPEEANEAFCFGADAGIFSRYVSRGVTLSPDPVFQPDVWALYSGFGVSVWGNMDLTDVNGNQGEFNELDFTAGYSGRWDAVSYSAGCIYYVFPNTGDDDTAELYASLGYDTLLQPTLTVFYDFLEADGFYCALGIGHGFKLPMPSDALSASLELSAQAGWGSKGFNEFNSGSYHDTFTDAVFTACLPFEVFESFSLTPSVSYSTALDRTIRTKNSDNDNIVFGLTVSAGM